MLYIINLSNVHYGYYYLKKLLIIKIKLKLLLAFYYSFLQRRSSAIIAQRARLNELRNLTTSVVNINKKRKFKFIFLYK